MKPVVLPMLHLLGAGEDGDGLYRNVRRAIAADAEHAFELVREHFDKPGQHVAPVFENPFGARVDGLLGMSFLSRFNVYLKPNGIELTAIQIK